MSGGTEYFLFAGSGLNVFARWVVWMWLSAEKYMTISDKIYISGAHTGHWNTQAVKDACTYPNPDYMNARRLGFSTRFIPKTIETWQERNDVLAIERGEIRKVTALLAKDSIEERGIQTMAKFTYDNKDFKLDQYQIEAIEAINKWKQGIVHAVTSAGKTHIVLAAASTLGRRTLILVHRKILAEQFLTDIKKYVRVDGRPIKKGEYGLIGNGSFQIGTCITVAMVQTFGKRIEEIEKDFGAVFLDECHLVPAATFSNVVNSLPAARRYGLTGTIHRKDKKDFLMYASFGQIIATIEKEALLALGRVSPVEVRIAGTGFSLSERTEEETITARWSRTIEEIHHDRDRRALVLEEINKGGDFPVLVLLNRVEACYEYEAAYMARYPETCGVITGRDSTAASVVFNRLLSGECRVCFATVACVSTGISVPDLRRIVLATPIFTNESLIHQIRGRLMRKSEGKEKGVLTFIWDPLVFEHHKLQSFKRIMAK